MLYEVITGAQAEEVEAVRLDHEPGFLGHAPGHLVQVQGLGIDDGAAFGADDMRMRVRLGPVEPVAQGAELQFEDLPLLLEQGSYNFV